VRQIPENEAVLALGTGYGALNYGEGKYGGTQQVLVLANSGTRALSSVLQNVIDAWRRVAGLALPTPGGGACHPLTESATLRLSAEVRIRAVVCDLQISRALRSQRVKQSPEMPHPQGDHWESSNGECGDAQKGRTHP